MAKLHGAAKKKFLARMAKGRRAAKKGHRRSGGGGPVCSRLAHARANYLRLKREAAGKHCKVGKRRRRSNITGSFGPGGFQITKVRGKGRRRARKLTGRRRKQVLLMTATLPASTFKTGMHTTTSPKGYTTWESGGTGFVRDKDRKRRKGKKKTHKRKKGHRSHASYVKAGKKAARTRARHHRARVAGAKKAARTRARRGHRRASRDRGWHGQPARHHAAARKGWRNYAAGKTKKSPKKRPCKRRPSKRR